MQGERWWQAGAAQLAGRWWPAGGYKDMWVLATTDQCMKPPHTPTEQTALMTARRMPGQSPATSSQREATSSPRVRALPTLPSAAAAGAAGNTTLRQEADTSPSETTTRSSTNPPGTVATQTEEPLAFTASYPSTASVSYSSGKTTTTPLASAPVTKATQTEASLASTASYPSTASVLHSSGETSTRPLASTDAESTQPAADCQLRRHLRQRWARRTVLQ